MNSQKNKTGSTAFLPFKNRVKVGPWTSLNWIPLASPPNAPPCKWLSKNHILLCSVSLLLRSTMDCRLTLSV